MQTKRTMPNCPACGSFIQHSEYVNAKRKMGSQQDVIEELNTMLENAHNEINRLKADLKARGVFVKKDEKTLDHKHTD